jgi:hypothetical protein
LLLAFSFEITVVGQQNHGREDNVGNEEKYVPGMNVHLHCSFLIGFCVVLTLGRLHRHERQPLRL